MMKEIWTYKKLGEVCESDLGKTLNSKTDTGEYYPYLCAVNILWDKIDLSTLKTARFESSELERYSVKKGDLLVCEGGDIGRAAIWKEDKPIQYQNALHRIRFNGDMLPRFLLMYLHFLKNTGVLDNNYGKGVTIKHLVKSSFLSIPVPVPPLETQSRIVSELDLLQSIIDKQQAQLKELDNLAQAIFYDMFGDPVENEKGWEVKKLGEVCTFLQGEQVPIEEQYFEKKDGTIRFLRIIDFTQGNDEPRYVFCKDEKHVLHDKEIAIVRYGTPGFVCYGKYGLIANNLFKVVPKYNNSFDFHYLVSWLESPAFQSTVQGNQYGAALQAIKFGTIQNISIIIPPLSFQQSFAAKIESIEKQKAAISQSIAETQKLFDYTMDKYFG